MSSPTVEAPVLGTGQCQFESDLKYVTIAVDFDGVIHSYENGWQDGSIYGDLLPDSIFGLTELMAVDSVFIFTSRDPEQVADWMGEKGFSCTTQHDGDFWNDRGVLLVTNKKYPATAYIDDRGIRFESWMQVLVELDIMN